MHLGNRNYGDWNSTLLGPFDPTLNQGGTWPRIVVALSHEVFRYSRDSNCRITSGGISIANGNIYSFLRRAALGGQTKVIIRIYPSPGNFLESVTDSNWYSPTARTSDRTLYYNLGQRPNNKTQCEGDSYGFRTADDIGDEILAIQGFVNGQGWSVYGFEPANEPNTEWYGDYGTTRAYPDYTQGTPWTFMDLYFANIFDYVHLQVQSPSIRVLTPPMAQNANAELVSMWDPACSHFEAGTGYTAMPLVFDGAPSKNDGYTWHNYFRQTKESYTNCPNGEHLSMFFPLQMSDNIYFSQVTSPAFITEADLVPPPDNFGNPITDKDAQATAAANSIRDFLYYETNSSAGRGASLVADWLLNDDCNPNDPNTDKVTCQKAKWAQAYDSDPGTNFFRSWFNLWWYGPEPHVN